MNNTIKWNNFLHSTPTIYLQALKKPRDNCNIKTYSVKCVLHQNARLVTV